MLTMMGILGFIIALGFVAVGLENVLHRRQRNRRIAREYKDQQQWERFSSRETK